MKRLLFLLAILMASLPSWAAEEEIFLKFSTSTGTSGTFNKIGDGAESKEYTAKVYGKYMPVMSSGNFALESFSGPGNLKTGCAAVDYFEFFKDNSSIYKITFSPRIAYSSPAGAYCFASGNIKRLHIYSSTIKPEIVITSTNTTEYPINRVVFGDAYNNTTSKPFTESNLNLISVTNSVDGDWSFSDGSLIFTPKIPQTEIKFKVTDNTDYSTLRIGHLGIVRAVKSPAPTLSDEIINSKTFPMMVDGELQTIDDQLILNIKQEYGVKYVYTVADPGETVDLAQHSTDVSDIGMMIMGLEIGANKVVHVAAVEDDGSIGNVLQVPCRRVAVPKVEYGDATFETMAEKGEITIEKPLGVETVYYSFLDDDPKTKGTELPADGKITLPSLETGSSIKLNLVAYCGEDPFGNKNFGEVTTVKCRRVALAKPMVVGYTENFKLRTEGQYLSQKFYLDDFNPSSFKTANNENGIALQANHLLLNLQSAYTLTPDGTGPFVEAQVSTSDTPDTDGSWLQLTAPIEDYPKYLLFEEGDSFEQTQFLLKILK